MQWFQCWRSLLQNPRGWRSCSAHSCTFFLVAPNFKRFPRMMWHSGKQRCVKMHYLCGFRITDKCFRTAAFETLPASSVVRKLDGGALFHWRLHLFTASLLPIRVQSCLCSLCLSEKKGAGLKRQPSNFLILANHSRYRSLTLRQGPSVTLIRSTPFS